MADTPTYNKHIINNLALKESEEYETTKTNYAELPDSTIRVQPEITPATSENNVRKSRRVKSKAIEIVDVFPEKLATPSLQNYGYSLSLHKEGNAFLVNTKGIEAELTVIDKRYMKQDKRCYTGTRNLFFDDLQNISTTDGIEKIDLLTLHYFYTLLLKKFETDKHILRDSRIKLFVPDMARYFGIKSSIGETTTLSLIKKARSFTNVMGIVKESNSNIPSCYPALLYHGFDSRENTITISSPYIENLLQSAYNAAIITNAKGCKITDQKNEPKTKPWNSYLVKPEILKERNKTAAENVFIICNVIEQAGNNVPHISAKTIIDRNVSLNNSYNKSTNKNQVLRRVFQKTWELLDSMTDLKTIYKDIVLPDPKTQTTYQQVQGLIQFILSLTTEKPFIKVL